MTTRRVAPVPSWSQFENLNNSRQPMVWLFQDEGTLLALVLPPGSPDNMLSIFMGHPERLMVHDEATNAVARSHDARFSSKAIVRFLDGDGGGATEQIIGDGADIASPEGTWKHVPSAEYWLEFSEDYKLMVAKKRR